MKKWQIVELKIAESWMLVARLRIAGQKTWKIAQHLSLQLAGNLSLQIAACLSLQIVACLSLQIAACLQQIAAEMIADCWTWMSWIVARRMIAGRTVVAQNFAWIVARAAVVLAPASAAAVEVAIAVAVGAFADRVQIYFYAACGLNGFS
jgi:hypothetical protein